MIPSIKQFFRRVKRTVEYLPIIWRGYDFDYQYAIELFKYQLERTAEFLDSDRAYGMDAKKNSFRIKTAIALMQKVYDDEYGSEWVEQIQKEYGPTVLNFTFEEIDENHPEFPEFAGNSFLKSEYEYWDNAKEVQRRISELIQIGQKKQEKAERILWQWINHNIKSWWD